MRLVNMEYNISLEFEENRTAILVVEEKKLRYKLIDELYHQCEGEDGQFILSDNMQILKLNKVADIIMNPFSIDFNNRKVLAKLYQEIEVYGTESYYEEKQRINGDILKLFDKIMLNVPYNITTKLEFELAEICKLYNVQLEDVSDTLLEKSMEYIRIMSQLCALKVFIFVNLTIYLTKDEIKELYNFSFNQKVYLLLIEFIMPENLCNEKGCVIDEDGCIIEIGYDNLQHSPSVSFGENPNEFEV